MHARNGNRNGQKKLKYLKIVEFNKPNSLFNTNIEILKYLIKREVPDICFITESNSEPKDDLASSFPGYDVFHKMELNHPLDRIVALVKQNKFTYEQMCQISDENIASLWFKVKLEIIN